MTKEQDMLREFGSVLKIPHTHREPGDSDCLACVLAEVFHVMSTILALGPEGRAEVLAHVERIAEIRKAEVSWLVDGPKESQ